MAPKFYNSSTLVRDTNQHPARPMNAPLRLCLYSLLSVAFVLSLIAQAYANPQRAASSSNPRYASIVIDAQTGAVLHERYADSIRHPASVAKVMTLMLMFDALNAGRAGLKDRIRISAHAAGMVPSKIGLPVGASIAVEDAILALVTRSANDIAAAMAEHLGGTESNFARMMTTKAREIGMRHTTFKNASGLHHPQQVTTARDLAILTRAMIYSYPRQYKYFSTRNFTFQGVAYRNHNRLMETYPGMDGMKTGFINASGFNLAASATRGNHRLIGVVMGGRTTQTRNAHMAKLLDEGFATLRRGAPPAPRPGVEPLIMAGIQPVPVPPRKPGASSMDAQSIAGLSAIAPASANPSARMAHSAQSGGLHPSEQRQFAAYKDAIVEQGDSSASGVISSNAQNILRAPPSVQPARIRVPTPSAEPSTQQQQRQAALQSGNRDNLWSVQIGAFSNRSQTDIVLGRAVQQLPEDLRMAQPIILPMQRDNNWIYRARLVGFTQTEAHRACRYLTDCIPVKP
ncbi:MAG: serine hydrolase [Alphaproteobacteria bacterium]